MGRKPATTLRHVDAETPIGGMDPVDRCRRRYAILWRGTERYNGTAYPDAPGADRKAVAEVLRYHRRNKIAVPWTNWMLLVMQAYLDIADDGYIVRACHPLSLLPRNLPRIVTAMKEAT